MSAPSGVAPLTADLEQVFGELADLRRWIVWQQQTRKGKPTKVPISPVTGRPTDATKPDPEEHVTLETALTYAEQAGVDGVGIILGAIPELGVRLGGIDLDACRDPVTGQLTPWAVEIVEQFRTYTEISPSESGLKLLSFGGPLEVPCSEIPQGTPPINGKAAEIAVYPGGRYFTVTGRIIEGVPDEIGDRGEVGGAWDEIVRRLHQHQASKNGSAPGRSPLTPSGATEMPEKLREVLGGNSKAGKLWRGGKGGGNDRSVNDAALAGTLGAMGFHDDEIEAAIRSYPHGQVGQGALTGGDADRQVSRLLGMASEARANRDDVADDRPAILIREELTAVTNEALDAIEAMRDSPVFVRGRMLVTVGRDGSARDRWLRRPPGSPVIVPIEMARMLGILDEAASFEKWNEKKKGAKPARPPEWVAKQVLARLEWPFRYLEAVTETPTIRGDGTILSDPGWDEGTGILYEPMPGAQWPTVPRAPTAQEIRQAVEALTDPVRDFPFISGSDRGAFVAAVLSLLARHRIHGPVPMFVVRAPTPATGKTLLAEVIALIGTGRNPPAMTMTYESEELRKRVTALAVGGTPLVMVDNLSGSLGSDALAAALTATEWEDRILGQTQMVRVPLRCVWLATGNNLGFKRTLGRRVVPIDLDAKVEVPEDRTGFRYPDLLAHVRRERPALVTAALTLLRGFHVAGLPTHGNPRMGSFESWDDVIRSCVIWAGMDDPATTEDGAGRGRIRAQSDDDLEGLANLLDTLSEMYPNGEPFSTAQIIAKAARNPELQVVLDTVAAPARGGHATSHSVGARLRDNLDRPVGGLVLRKVARVWKIEPMEGAP